MEYIRETNDYGKIINDSTSSYNEEMSMRENLIQSYCSRKGWNRSNLTAEQMNEINTYIRTNGMIKG